MKKLYITPVSTAISLYAPTILAGSSTNSYGGNQGNIIYNPNEVSAEDAD